MDARDRRLAIFAAVTGVVVTSSLVPMPAAPHPASSADPVSSTPGTDKLVHAVGYAAVAYTLGRALPARVRRGADGPPIAVLLGVVAVATAIGAGVEISQGIVPGRDPSALDGVANAVGAVVGVVLWRRRGGDRPRRRTGDGADDA